jgi:hypothetical protein
VRAELSRRASAAVDAVSSSSSAAVDAVSSSSSAAVDAVSSSSSAAVDVVSSSSGSLSDAVRQPLEALQDGVQQQAPLMQPLQQASCEMSHLAVSSAMCQRWGQTVCSCSQVQDDPASFSAQQAHFGRDAIESALNTAAPGLLERSAELLQRLQDQLGDVARDLPGLPSAGDTGAPPTDEVSSWQGS